jgi:F-type H+-transporting ATPase subunit gamma
MASIHEIKLRMKSIKDTKQITNAMMLISSSKLKKARQWRDQTMPFFNTIKETIAEIMMHSENIESNYFDTRNDKIEKKTGFVILSGDKGLAGGYNHNLLNFTKDEIEKVSNPKMYIAGLIGRLHFRKLHYELQDDFLYNVQNPNLVRAGKMCDVVLDHFIEGEIDEVYLIYTEMINSLNLVPKKVKLLPLDFEELKQNLGYKADELVERDERLTYEPSPGAVFDVLVRKYLKGILYSALVESYTSELNARMAAMEGATKNADKMLQELDLYYNRARQAAITQEITEIIGGAEAIQ